MDAHDKFRYVVRPSDGPPHTVVEGDRVEPLPDVYGDVEISSGIEYYKIYRQEPGERQASTKRRSERDE